MPLKKGKSQSTISSNISEMMHKFKKTGSMGNIHTTNKKKQLQIATAAAYSKAGKSRKK